jgi:NADH-quinone oxidoreductase subunit J
MTLTLSLFFIYVVLFFFAVAQETTFSMVFSLILVFLVACFLVISLGFEFLGYLILIVYIGAIAVLFLFMVMLFDRSEYKMFNLVTTRESKMIIFILSLVLSMSFPVLFYDFVHSYPILENQLTPESIHFLFGGKGGEEIRTGAFSHDSKFETINITDIELIGLSLYSDFFIPFLLAGFGLLIAMIGCIILTRNSFLKTKVRKTQVIEDQLNRYKL